MRTHIFKCIKGTIKSTSGIEKEVSSKGREIMKAQLWICDESNPDGIDELAVTVSGENINFVGCEGYRVECKYWNRSFSFKDKKTGRIRFGNEAIAEEIKPISQRY